MEKGDKVGAFNFYMDKLVFL